MAILRLIKMNRDNLESFVAHNFDKIDNYGNSFVGERCHAQNIIESSPTGLDNQVVVSNDIRARYKRPGRCRPRSSLSLRFQLPIDYTCGTL